MTGDGSIIGAEDGVMTEGLTADEAAAAILPNGQIFRRIRYWQLRFFKDGRDETEQPDTDFSRPEQMAASLHQ